MREVSRVTIRNAQLLKRNFSGKKLAKWDKEGVPTFLVRLDEEIAEDMRADGWNVKQFATTEEYPEPSYYLSVDASFDRYPPRIELITSVGRRGLSEHEINQLDWLEMENVSLTLNPRVWDDNGVQKVKAYLKTMFVTVIEDELDADYADVPYVN